MFEEYAKDASPLPGEQVLQLEFFYKIVNRSQFEQLQSEARQHNSPSYGKPMTSAEINRRFRPPQIELDEIVQWLTQQGFTVTEADKNHAAFYGTVAQAEAAFQVTILKSARSSTYGILSDPCIPARFSDAIGSVLGLENGGAFAPRIYSPASPTS